VPEFIQLPQTRRGGKADRQCSGELSWEWGQGNSWTLALCIAKELFRCPHAFAITGQRDELDFGVVQINPLHRPQIRQWRRTVPFRARARLRNAINAPGPVQSMNVVHDKSISMVKHRGNRKAIISPQTSTVFHGYDGLLAEKTKTGFGAHTVFTKTRHPLIRAGRLCSLR
jgi:hypothetical protein